MDKIQATIAGDHSVLNRLLGEKDTRMLTTTDDSHEDAQALLDALDETSPFEDLEERMESILGMQVTKNIKGDKDGQLSYDVSVYLMPKHLSSNKHIMKLRRSWDQLDKILPRTTTNTPKDETTVTLNPKESEWLATLSYLREHAKLDSPDTDGPQDIIITKKHMADGVYAYDLKLRNSVTRKLDDIRF
jgi:hypothetical protein